MLVQEIQAAWWYGHHHKSVWVNGGGGCTRFTVVSSNVGGASARLSLAGCTLFLPSRRRALDSCVRGRASLNTGVKSHIYCCYLHLSSHHSFLFHSFADPYYRGWLFVCRLPCSQPFQTSNIGCAPVPFYHPKQHNFITVYFCYES